MEIKNTKIVYTPPYINWIVFFVGTAIVWFSSHNLWAVLGAFIASLHIQSSMSIADFEKFINNELNDYK